MSAWTVPSSPNGPWSAMKTTGGARRGEAIQRGADRERPVGAERRRIVVGGRRAIATAVPGWQPPPPAVEIDQDLADVEPGVGRAPAMAVPDTTDTSCSADGPPSRTTTGG